MAEQIHHRAYRMIISMIRVVALWLTFILLVVLFPFPLLLLKTIEALTNNNTIITRSISLRILLKQLAGYLVLVVLGVFVYIEEDEAKDDDDYPNESIKTLLEKSRSIVTFSHAPDDEVAKKFESEVKSREKLLAPLYTQIAHEFADLHDRAGRMKAKGCITEVLEWKTARGYFYWRIKRRLAEDSIKERLIAASNGLLTSAQAAEKVASVCPENSDKGMATWVANNAAKVETLIADTRKEFAAKSVLKTLEGLSSSDIKDILNQLQK